MEESNQKESGQWECYSAILLDVCKKKENKSGELLYVALEDSRKEAIIRCYTKGVMLQTDDLEIKQHNNGVVIVMPDKAEAETTVIARNAQRKIEELLAPDETTLVAVGKTVGNIDEIGQSIHMAERMVTLARSDYKEDITLSCDNAYLDSLLLDVADDGFLKKFYEHTIQPLIEYDANNGSNLAETLETYLEQNGSVHGTASELMVHSNNIADKLQRIERILDVTITSFDVRTRLAVGIRVAKMLGVYRR